MLFISRIAIIVQMLGCVAIGIFVILASIETLRYIMKS